jgi:hypothetical protein
MQLVVQSFEYISGRILQHVAAPQNGDQVRDAVESKMPEFVKVVH